MRRSSLPAFLLCAGLALTPRAGRADAATEAKLRDALRSTTTQLRTLEDQRAGWEAKEGELKKELEALRAQSKAATRSKAADREAEELKRRLGEQTEAAAKAGRALAQCEMAREDGSRTAEQERKQLTARSDKLAESLAAAEARNEAMYKVGKGLIDWMQKEGIGGEPFLGLRRVALENAAQVHEDKLIDQRVKPLGAP
jgi:chromosome segregation ATPase